MFGLTSFQLRLFHLIESKALREPLQESLEGVFCVRRYKKTSGPFRKGVFSSVAPHALVHQNSYNPSSRQLEHYSHLERQ
jgi:hypothetical protein